MNNKLDNLKEKMNETVLKNIDFSEESKKKVLRTVQKSQNKKNVLFSSKTKYIINTSLSCILIFGLGYFGLKELNLTTNSKPLTFPIKEQEQDKNQRGTTSTSIYTPPEKEEMYEDMSKNEIFTKMLNSIDHFHTAVGKYEIFTTYHDRSTSTTIEEFEISTKEQIGGSSIVFDIYPENNDKHINKIFYNESNLWHLDEARKTFVESDYHPITSQTPFTVEEAISIDPLDIYNAEYRERPPVGTTVLFPYEKATSYLRDVKMWDIDKQNEEIAGQNTIVLKGTVDPQINRMMPEESFRFWVDKDTGILVKFEGYDSNGEITSYIYSEKLQINTPIDTKEFTPNLEGYTAFDEHNNPLTLTAEEQNQIERMEQGMMVYGEAVKGGYYGTTVESSYIEELAENKHLIVIKVNVRNVRDGEELISPSELKFELNEEKEDRKYIGEIRSIQNPKEVFIQSNNSLTFEVSFEVEEVSDEYKFYIVSSLDPIPTHWLIDDLKRK
ncbi:hypothetical protein FS935_18655 [Metabacillus litoralis]|uniref:MucB/RseB N-terminal domain-containing protein n=1 Tax=Metabacillus litoralis TaxID=152268 RepID=A0A5C6VLI6_9BACI|nr:hypothetical protein [Metabacillus litoralis]TXC86067.1 hypothetical protein FS935_18655 [Metabacillus litoralis]